MRHVASDEGDRRTVFVQEASEPWIKVRDATELRSQTPPSGDDLAAASTILVERGLAQPGAKVNSYGRIDHLPEPLQSPRQPTAIYSPDGLEQHLETVNKGYVEDLVQQLRSPLGVIPFVGAGMSAEFGFPLWDTFLRECAAQTGLENEIEQLLSASDFESAAERLDEHDPKWFGDRILHVFRRPVDPSELRGGAISYLPLLTSGPVITTNFDRLLEDAFAEAGIDLRVIDGPREDPTVVAVHRNQRAVLKIHGTYDDRTFRVFTKDEYERGYEDRGVTLKSLAWLTFTNRPLLFLGCSLESDRTVEVLAEIHRRLPALKHYAVLAAHYSRSRQTDRQQQLSSWGISPIWYPPGQFDRIARILRNLVEEAATKPVRPAAAVPRTPVPPGDGDLLRAVDLHAPERHRETAAVVDALLDGELVLFLGAYAHLGEAPLGKEFYDALAMRFEQPPPEGHRSAIATLVARRRGPRALWEEARRMVAPEIEPSAVYRVVTALPAFLRSRGQHSPVWILTTNYDAVLEQELERLGEPFHVFYFMEPDGLFAHTAPDGSVRVIERPDAIRDLRPPGTVVVKMNGGIMHGAALQESVVIDSAQFERLADRLPGALPACARAVLRDRSLLFLGHGLAEADTNRVIMEFAVGAKRGSWAVQLPPEDPDRRRIWDQERREFEGLGLTTIVCDLEEFVADLRAALLAA